MIIDQLCCHTPVPEPGQQQSLDEKRRVKKGMKMRCLPAARFSFEEQTDLDERLPNLLVAIFALLCRHLKPGAASPLVSGGEMFCGAWLFLLCLLPRRGQEPALPGASPPLPSAVMGW